MITQDTAELERYEARLKARRDKNAILHDARDEGVEFGRQEGLREGLIRTIRLGQAILRGTSQGSAELQSLSIAELQRLADELESQILASQRTSK